jgi:hypothetical protein
MPERVENFSPLRGRDSGRTRITQARAAPMIIERSLTSLDLLLVRQPRFIPVLHGIYSSIRSDTRHLLSAPSGYPFGFAASATGIPHAKQAAFRYDLQVIPRVTARVYRFAVLVPIPALVATLTQSVGH